MFAFSFMVSSSQKLIIKTVEKKRLEKNKAESLFTLHCTDMKNGSCSKSRCHYLQNI